MEIRDIIHGSILIEKAELSIIDSRHFQRLREIRQLGFAEFSFPTATHNRYVHSLGAMETATRALDTIFGGPSSRITPTRDAEGSLFKTNPQAFARFRAAMRLAALLHDIGHGPLSHTTEFAMPEVRELGISQLKAKGKGRKATHEDYTLKMILDSELTPRIAAAGRAFGFSPLHVAGLIEPSLEIEDDFFLEKFRGEEVDFRPILEQLISSELDADRMDYLRRDSLHTGVSYGQFDFDWVIGNLGFHIRKGKCFLGLHHRALYAFEDFLISRFHMFLMVYFHHKSVVFDSMLARYFESPDCDYSLPSDIEAYCEHTDSRIYLHLAKSKNPWARRITEKRPYRRLIELHTGIPAGKTAAQEQQRLLEKIKKRLTEQKIDYLSATTTSELSKYFRKPGDPIFVLYDNLYSAPSFIPIEKCTDLFERYSEKRLISRLYVSDEDYPLCRNEGRGTPLRYEESSPEITST